MNERIKSLLNYMLDKKHYRFRQEIKIELSEEFSGENLPDMGRVTGRLLRVLEAERPVILPGEKIVCLRTVCNIPDIYTAAEWEEIRKKHYIHELGRVNNLNPDYGTVIRTGLEEKRREAFELLKKCKEEGDLKGEEFLQSVIRSIDGVERFADMYRREAERIGNREVADVLAQVPGYGARTFHEALQFFRIIHYALWCEGSYQNTIGRFDQYMYPYLTADLKEGRLDYDEAFELLEEFFISFNKDNDLYYSLQLGDNGQSLVLGGVDGKGADAYNILSEMCLKASLELKLIDPKINLRVHGNTKPEIFELGTRLTAQGLGFPQYSNDDVVIPGLTAKGYDLEDARDYVVAACWEYIIPGKGMEIPNIEALSFIKVIDGCLHDDLLNCADFQSFMGCVGRGIAKETRRITESIKNIYIEPAPFQSILMDDCIKRARDVSAGAKYNNYGLHGAGIANAADSLVAIKKYVFEEGTITPGELIDAVDADFEGYYDLWVKLRYEAPKMGNDDDYVDNIAVELLNMFADALESVRNERGGCFRAGSGTAMYYLWHAKEIGASPDGRKKGEPLPANFSPSLHVKVKGPVSIIKSFSRPHMKKIINGGPLTLELHDTVFRNDEGIKKVALLVKSYMDMGGQQLQLNAVDRDVLLDAQKHPGLYKNLIVRVWGWSGYFIELEKEYQNHIIQRTEFKI